MTRRSTALFALLVGILALLVVSGTDAKTKPKPKKKKKPVPALTSKQKLAKLKHIVVIYEENHSFDNLYGGWEGVNGRASAQPATTTQVSQAGAPYTCLLQNDVNLAAPPRPASCTDTTTATAFTSAFTNAPFLIDTFIPSTATTCPPPAQAFSFPNGVLNGAGQPGGCTRDLVHEFYQEQYQLNGGQQNRYVTGSDSVGMTMGGYDTKQLPVYKYLHASGHPRYSISDAFFQAAFGGSFLNHQWLIAAATPTYPGAPANLHSILDANGMPVKYPLYTPTGPVLRGPITAVCPALNGLACGDFAVNTMQPTYQPFGAFGAKLIPQSAPTIGDRLTAKNIDWAWYSGGWSNANGDVNGPGWTNGGGPKCSDPNAIANSPYPSCPDFLFQFHHQPFNYYAAYAPGTPARTAHLRDEVEFTQLAQGSGSACKLKPVSFVKPLGEENEHPGYASEPNGSDHLVTLLRSIEGSACAKDTMVVVTYDEFGGQWDHVPPPGQGGAPGVHDQWGPGTRIPALVLSPYLRGPFVVDHARHDTTSILATIEHRFGLQPLSTRDAAVNDLQSVFAAKAPTG
jgi:acid phosphatase